MRSGQLFDGVDRTYISDHKNLKNETKLSLNFFAMYSIEIKNPGELTALRMVILAGKFPTDDREYRIFGNSAIARLCSEIFSIPLLGQAWEMNIESAPELLNSIRIGIEYASTNDIWNTFSENDIKRRISDAILPFSSLDCTSEELLESYRLFEDYQEKRIVEKEITGGKELYFQSTLYDPLAKTFSISLSTRLDNGATCCTVCFHNVSKFQIEHLDSDDMGFDNVTIQKTSLGHKFNFWTPGGLIQFYANSQVEISHDDRN